MWVQIPKVILVYMVTVVQLVRMSDCGSEGRRFDPDQSPKILERRTWEDQGLPAKQIVRVIRIGVGTLAFRKWIDLLAQLVEHNTFNVGVVGSSPTGITKFCSISNWYNLGQRRSWRGGTDCNNRVNCHKSLIGNWLEVSEYHTLLQSQSVAYGWVGSIPTWPTKAFQVGVHYTIVLYDRVETKMQEYW